MDNGDGTDHGWGGHHLVMGGSVAGGQFVGDIPAPDPRSEHFTDRRGRMIPTLPVEALAAELGGWLGLDETELQRALPKLVNFDRRSLGLFACEP